MQKSVNFCSIAGNTIIGPGIHTLNNLSTSPIFTEKINGTCHSWTDKHLNILIKGIYWK